MLKYTFLNITKTAKLYAPFFSIVALLLFILMCALGSREVIKAERENQFGGYAAAVIVNKPTDGNGYVIGMNPPPRSINEEFVEAYLNPEYISDYYVFSEYIAFSDKLKSVVLSPEWSARNERAKAEKRGYMPFDGAVGLPFSLTAYSDVSKSAHFRTGDWEMTEGRFAENNKECNISAELARLNGLSAGDDIEIYIYYDFLEYNRSLNDTAKAPVTPDYFKFKIAGVYEVYTEEIYSSELTLVAGKEVDKMEVLDYTVSIDINGETGTMTAIEGKDVVTYKFAQNGGAMEEIERVEVTQEEAESMVKTKTVSLEAMACVNRLSRNEILTASSVAPDMGYDVGVLYTGSQEAALQYIEQTGASLPEDFVFLDSAAMYRAVRLIFKNTESTLMRMLTITGVTAVLFCGLIIIYVLKDRTYDIGVFRVIGMSRVKITALITSEVLTVTALAYGLAGWLYMTAFPAFAGLIYQIYGNSLMTDVILNNFASITPDTGVLSAARDIKHFVSADLRGAVYGLLTVMGFTLLVSLSAALFIARHEPMKTMTEY